MAIGHLVRRALSKPKVVRELPAPRWRTASPCRQQHLYVIERNGRVKIGRSIQPMVRATEFNAEYRTLTGQEGHFMLLWSGPIQATTVEPWFHAALADYRDGGEWFRYTGLVADVVARLVNGESVESILNEILWKRGDSREAS